MSPSTRWEYMSVSYRYTREWVLPPGGPPGETVWKTWYEIEKPGAKVETRRSTDTSDSDLKGGAWWFDLMQEFGGEGWELVSETVLGVARVDEEGGWKDKDVPVNVRWTLKRPLEG